MKKILLGIITVIMCISTAFASETKGSITVNFNGKCSNMEMHLTKVADIIDGEYHLCEKYNETGINLNKIETANDLKTAAEKLETYKQSDISQTTDKKGITVFKDLDEAVYLVYAQSKNNQDKVEPSLIAIPTYDEGEGVMLTDVELFPKHVSQKKPPQTGDEKPNMMPVLLVLLLSASVSVICYAIKKNKKRKIEK